MRILLSRLTRVLPSWKALFPFLRWFPLGAKTIQADFIAGVTGGLVLVPQAMAYAQLAGLPAHYGLYTGLLPGAVAALWGSSSKLSTGPVALVSLLTGSALAPLALAGSEYFITLAILLALLVGLIQLLLGVFKLGVVINFISHPVIVGFTNAAAIIIALSQLNKLLGVPMSRSDSFVLDIFEVLKRVGDTHLPTLALGIAAFAIMLGFKRYAPKFPGVLIAVVVTTVVSWTTGFERTASAKIDDLMHPIAKQLADEYAPTKEKIDDLSNLILTFSQDLRGIQETAGEASQTLVDLNYQIAVLKVQLAQLEAEQRERQRQLNQFRFDLFPGPAGRPEFYLTDLMTKGGKPHPESWRIRKIERGEIRLAAGGEVVGKIPSGLPTFALPPLNWRNFVDLFSIALVISLVGFMEAISIAKGFAAKTKERLDPSQELIGQGLANIAGSLTQSFPSSGSFARSAVNFNAGAVTGFSTVFATLVVLATLLFLTPLLYYLPQSVLAAVVMMAVAGLINFNAMKHIWQAHKHDGIAAVATFVAALALAPHLDDGILIGAGLSVGLYLYRRMNPSVVLLKHHAQDGLVESEGRVVENGQEVLALRFDGSLYFANVPYFQDAILEAIAAHAKTKYLLVVGDGINELDASGEEAIRHLVEDLRAGDVTLVFSGIKRQVLQVMERTGLYAVIGAQNFFRSEEAALEEIKRWIGGESPEETTSPVSAAESETR